MSGVSTRVALLQMTSGIDVAENAAAISDAMERAAREGAAMLFTPEMALLLDRDRARAAISVTGGAIEQALSQLCTQAARLGLWLHIGSMPVADPALAPRWANRAAIIGPDGVVRATYDKMHMFDVNLPTGESWRESGGYAPGGEVVMVPDTPVGLLGISICYDLRFSALYDRFGAAGCQAIAIPAAFTVPTGSAHWHVLQRARAIEQGCFVIAAAQCGSHADGRQTNGHSLVIGPWGDMVLDMGQDSGLGFADIHLDRVNEVRAQLPSISHRRPIP
jgi:deaminated glutathione amidase